MGCETILRPSAKGDGYNQGEVCDRDRTTPGELPPFPVRGLILKGRNQTSENENEMSDATERHHHRVKPPYLTCGQEMPEGDCPSLDEMTHKKLQDIPENCDRYNRTETPHAVAARKGHDSYVDGGRKK
jgi:hypothetical protein